MNLIAYPPERIPVFFDALITCHEKAFEGPRAAPVGASESALTSSDVAEHGANEPEAPGVDADAFWMGENEAAESGFLDDAHAIPQVPEQEEAEAPDPVDQQSWSAESLNTGSWVDLALAGEWVRAQLTWASPHRTLFMFISGSGLAHSMSKRTMDRLRGMGLIRLVSDGRVMDNALDAVAQAALRNDVKNAGGGA